MNETTCCKAWGEAIADSEIERDAGEGLWNVNGCCGGGYYVLTDLRFCPWCGAPKKPKIKGMKSLDERIEAAARHLAGRAWNVGTRERFIENHYKMLIPDATIALQAAFPELFTDPPSAWIAPMEASGEMDDAAESALKTWVHEDEVHYEAYRAMRDAHLKGK